MFAVLEKNGELRPVHSNSDLAYMLARGWKQQVKEVPAILIPAPIKKRGRPAKAK